MRIIFTESFRHFKKGDKLTLDDKNAKALIDKGVAKKVAVKKAAPKPSK